MRCVCARVYVDVCMSCVGGVLHCVIYCANVFLHMSTQKCAHLQSFKPNYVCMTAAEFNYVYIHCHIWACGGGGPDAAARHPMFRIFLRVDNFFPFLGPGFLESLEILSVFRAVGSSQKTLQTPRKTLIREKSADRRHMKMRHVRHEKESHFAYENAVL